MNGATYPRNAFSGWIALQMIHCNRFANLFDQIGVFWRFLNSEGLIPVCFLKTRVRLVLL